MCDNEIEMIVDECDNSIVMINNDHLDSSFFTGIGTATIRRASHVEPDEQMRWLADMSPSNGPVLGPFDSRAEALQAEVLWLKEHM